VELATQEEFDVAVTVHEALFGRGSSTLEVSGTDAILNGDLGTLSYIQMRDMAVDLFAAGLTRTVDEGGILGVHSWCCNEEGLTGGSVPHGDEDHGTQLTYFREMLDDQGEGFYIFT
jgi:hypothetical protein